MISMKMIFPDHVKIMHQDRDNKFELEYEVRQAIL